MSRPAPTTPAAGGRRALRRPRGPRTVDVDVVVIGAGQAGLSTAYHLHRTGLTPVGTTGWERARGTFVVLDDNPRAGGAWQHRWPWLTMADVHGVHDLPGMPLTMARPEEAAADAVPYYFAQYEEAFGLNVQRPVRVTRVERADVAEGGEPRFLVTTHHAQHPDEVVVWSARGLVNASGTWGRPFWPAYPGRAAFRGRQLHARDVRALEDLADGHVVVVGGGTSAVTLVRRLADVTTTTWVTRRPPHWVDGELTPEAGRAAVARVDDAVRAGHVPPSVVSVTGLPLTPANRAAIDAGVLRARPVFTRIVPDGVVWDDTGRDDAGRRSVGGEAAREVGGGGAGREDLRRAGGGGVPRGDLGRVGGGDGASRAGRGAGGVGGGADRAGGVGDGAVGAGGVGGGARGAGADRGADGAGEVGGAAGANGAGAAVGARGAVTRGATRVGGAEAEADGRTTAASGDHGRRTAVALAGSGDGEAAASAQPEVDLGAWVSGPAQVEARTILWATGFRPALDHLAPLGLRAPGGGILTDGTEAVAEPRVQLVGYGPSASTVGANRAGREAARRLRLHLGW